MLFLLYFVCLVVLTVLVSLGMRENNTCLEFVHIPKNAGTSIENTYTEQVWSERRGIFVNGHLMQMFRNGFIAYFHDTDLIPTTTPTFCVIRDPYKKFISALNFRMYLAEDWPIHRLVFSDIRQWKGRMHEFFAMLKKTPHAYSNFFLPQTHFAMKCTHVLHMDHLEEELAILLPLYNIPVKPLRRDNVKRSSFFVEADVPRSLVESFYEDDYRLFHMARSSDFRLLDSECR